MSLLRFATSRLLEHGWTIKNLKDDMMQFVPSEGRMALDSVRLR